MKKLYIKNIGTDNKGINTLKITIDDTESVNIPIPILKQIINNTVADGSFYDVYKDNKKA